MTKHTRRRIDIDGSIYDALRDMSTLSFASPNLIANAILHHYLTVNSEEIWKLITQYRTSTYSQMTTSEAHSTHSDVNSETATRA